MTFSGRVDDRDSITRLLRVRDDGQYGTRRVVNAITIEIFTNCDTIVVVSGP